MQMKEDMNIIKYFIINLYQEDIEDPSKQREIQFKYNCDKMQQKSEKLRVMTTKLDKELLKSIMNPSK